MLIGIVGAPNKGKSTLFSALTLNDVAIADYPFTTIDPNVGIAYAIRECPCKSMPRRCNARNSLCVDGMRKIPINVIDVAGLVEGAHIGKGMGNRFLNDLSAADVLVIVADASGMTNSAGLRSPGSNPIDDIEMVESELCEWVISIINRHMNTLSKSKTPVDALHEVLTGMKISRESIESAISTNYLTSTKIDWNEEGVRNFSRSLLKLSKPYIIAANKMDTKDAAANAAKIEEEYGKENVVRMSAAVELALAKAEHNGTIKWTDDRSFEIIKKIITPEQKSALEYMQHFIEANGRGVVQLSNKVTFDLFDNMVVYPVEDEHRYSDSNGNVLPDAILLKKGSTAHDLAMKIHTEIGDKMLYAIDARRKVRIGKDHVLQDNDIIKIVSAAK